MLLNYSTGQRFDHDPALPLPPIPALSPITRLQNSELSDAGLQHLLVLLQRRLNYVTQTLTNGGEATGRAGAVVEDRRTDVRRKGIDMTKEGKREGDVETAQPKSLYGPVFADKVALITGAAHGFGRSISVLLASRGAKVLMVDINERELEDTL